MEHQCKDCGAWTRNRNYCDPCIDADNEMIDNFERSYVERCEASEEYAEVAHERKVQRDEQRYLENDANWI